MSSREKIISLLKSFGPSRADRLATELGVTSMAIRQHLYGLRDDGLVIETTKAMGRGRPAKVWALTEKANVYFPNAHRELAVGLITDIRDSLGEAAMDALLDARLQKQKLHYETKLEGKNSLKQKLELIATERTNEGYMAHVEPSDNQDAYILAEAHCPICEAAKACSGLCARELELFQKLMGEDYTVKRTDHILKGANRCAYEITKTNSETKA